MYQQSWGGSCIQVQSANNVNVYDVSGFTSLVLSWLVQGQVLTKGSVEDMLGMREWKNTCFTEMHWTDCSLQAIE